MAAARSDRAAVSTDVSQQSCPMHSLLLAKRVWLLSVLLLLPLRPPLLRAHSRMIQATLSIC